MKHLTLSDAEIFSFAKGLDYLPPSISANPNFFSGVRDTLLALDKLASLEHCRAGAENLKLDVKPESLQERILLRSEKIVIAGLRFKSGNKNFPFLRLHFNFRPDREFLNYIFPLARKAFPDFSPRGFTLLEAPRSQLRMQEQIWSQILWGKTEAPHFSFPAALRFVTEKDTAFYPTYREEFQRWLPSRPDLTGFIRWEEEEDFQKAIANNLVFSVYDPQGWRGVIAGEAKKFMGADAVYIFEIFLADRLRGQGMAKALQANFLAKVKDTYSHVWGHIHAKNLSSQKTAMSLGREVVQSEYFFDASTHDPRH